MEEAIEKKVPTIQEIIKKAKKNNRKSDSNLILKTYEYARDLHENQFRKSGEQYIIHPLHVANILAELEMDDASIVAALLHDILEDTEITESDLRKEFGQEIVELVDGVTKLRKIRI